MKELYVQVATKAGDIETELRRLNRWCAEPLSPVKFENMGAFGSNTMSFEEWLQFVLMPRINQIIEEHDSFPDSSMLAPYAIRYFDGDPEAGPLHELLYELDGLIDRSAQPEKKEKVKITPSSDSVTLGISEIPQVIFTLLEVLPQFEGEGLESQLQTYDTFLDILSPAVRPVIAKLLEGAANKTTNEDSKVRILKAAISVTDGGRAAAPYNHDEAMKQYQEEHKKNFPTNS